MISCPRCLEGEFWSLKGGRIRCKQCGLTRVRVRKTNRISTYWHWRLVEFFCMGVPAYRLRFRIPLSLPTIQKFFRWLRQIIYDVEVKELELLSGAIEMDESAFGGKRKGKRGWGSAGKLLVFGIYKRNGKVLTFPISSRSGDTLIPLITHHTQPGGLYYTDDWHAYTFLPIHGNHVVVRKEKGRPKGRDHLNGIEGFWSYAKTWLYHYRGVPKTYFHLYLKEVEWRFNHRRQDLVPLLRNLLKQQIVKEQV